jgi:hypothetical protein
MRQALHHVGRWLPQLTLPPFKLLFRLLSFITVRHTVLLRSNILRIVFSPQDRDMRMRAQ